MISIDQLGQKHVFKQTPSRIVSLVPSITELICDLGLRDYIVGCTKFCVHPNELKNEVTIVGGTKSVQYQRVEDCQPDIIIANKEENRQEDIKAILAIAPIWISDIGTIEEAASMINSLGQIFNVEERVKDIINRTNEIVSEFPKTDRTAAYLIWKDPYMTVGQDTYIHDMMDKLGLTNVFSDMTRYPEVSIEELCKRSPDFVFLSSEPFPFKQRHLDNISGQLKDSVVIFVDGEFFSWYGSRLIHMHEYAHTLIEDLRVPRSPAYLRKAGRLS